MSGESARSSLARFLAFCSALRCPGIWTSGWQARAPLLPRAEGPLLVCGGGDAHLAKEFNRVRI
eukprot:9925801-Lingulodinium_polyedra.AAC.1